MKRIMLVVGLLVIVSNMPPLTWFYGCQDCQFSNGDGSFTFAESLFKGAGFQQCDDNFQEFKKRNLGDTTLYRLCPMNIFHFWDYGQYLFAEKYRLPYKEWSEIEARRGEVINKSGFQDF